MAEIAETDLETLSAMAAEFEACATGVLDHVPYAVALGEYAPWVSTPRPLMRDL